jgi:diphthine synthase
MTDGKKTGLALIGIGPGKVSSMTLEAVDLARHADIRLYEAYTALWSEEALVELEVEIGPIQRIMRPTIEQPEDLLEMAKNQLVAVLVVGDPMQATTHIDLQLRAENAGLLVHIVHGISITTLVPGVTGVSNYKFGRSTTLTYPYGEWIATSPLEVMLQNYSHNLHTLVLFDLDPSGAGTGDQRPMQAHDAADSIAKMVAKYNEMELTEEQRENIGQIGEFEVVLCSDLGTDDQRLQTTTIGNLSTKSSGRLNCMVLLANLSEIEREAVNRWK